MLSSTCALLAARAFMANGASFLILQKTFGARVSQYGQEAKEQRQQTDRRGQMVIDRTLAELYCQKAEELVAFIAQQMLKKSSQVDEGQ